MDNDLKTFLEENDYMGIREVPGHGVCGLQRFMFTSAIVCGMDYTGRRYRYCYHTLAEAALALMEWDGQGHPGGDWIVRKGEGGDVPNPN